MGYGRKWKPSKAKVTEYASKMNSIDEFCKLNDIHQSSSSDSYYFTIDGVDYRVSNHTVDSSNRKAYNSMREQVRSLYHPGGERENVVYITAGKTRIIEIYNDLKNGYELDRRGNRK